VTVSSNSPICQGDVLYLNVTTINNVSYTWSGPNGFSSNIQNPSISQALPINSGVYTVTIVHPGCVTPLGYTTSVAVSTTNNNVVIGQNGPVCTGSVLQLSATVLPGATYTWSGPGGFSANTALVSIPNVTTASSGQYSIAVVNPGCLNYFNTLVATVYPSLVVTAGSNSPVCQGGILYLTNSSHTNATYAWSGPNGFTSNQVNPSLVNIQPTSSGTYSLIVTQPSCGTVSTTVPVIVGANISNVTTTSNSPICSGQNLTLSSTSIPGATYVWSGPNGFSSALANPPSIVNAQTLNSGNYSLAVSSPGCGTLSLTSPVTIIPSLAVNTSSNSPVCEGGVLFLSSSSHSMASYSWVGPNGFTSNIQNPSISRVDVSNSGIYTLTVTQQACGAQTQTLSVLIGPAINNLTPGSNSPICAGNTLSLTAAPIVGATYAWSGPLGYTSSAISPNINAATVAQGGMYSLVISSPGCGTYPYQISTQVTDPVLPLAGVLQTPVCQGSVVALTSNVIPLGTYMWQGPAGFTSNRRDPSISNSSPSNSGIYTLTTTQPGCGSRSSTVSVLVGPSINNVLVGSNSPICVGNTLTMSATSLVGANYAWTGPNGFTGNTSSVSIPNAALINSGNYTVVISSPGCTTISQVLKVRVNSNTGASVSNTSPVCAGGVVTLQAMGGSGSTYSWSGPGGFQSTLQNPSLVNVQLVQAGNYTVTITDPACGPIQLVTLVQVGSNLNNLTATNSGPVCVNNAISLSASAIVGATYSWTGPNGFTSNLQNPVISNPGFGDAGVYSLTASTIGCLSVTRTTTIVITPPLTPLPSSTSPVCQGGALYFSSNNISGASYAWSGPQGFTSALAAPSITNVQTLAAGNYTLTISRPGCIPATATTSVTIGTSTNNVILTHNSPICMGNTLSVSSTNYNGTTTLWTAPDGFTSSNAILTRANAQPSMSGLYTFAISSPGCSQTLRTLMLTVNQIPVLSAGSNSPVCQGNALSLSVNTVTSASYNWSGPAGFTSAQQNPSITNAQLNRAGIYTLTVNSPTCGILTTTHSVVVGSNFSAPISVAHNSPVCVGGTINLTVTNRPGFTFNWNGPNGFTANIAQPSISGVSVLNAGRYTATISSPGCGVANFQTSTVTVNDPSTVSATSNSPVCVGASISLSAFGPGGTTWSWSGPMSFTSTVRNPTITNAQLSNSGVYSLNATVLGCGVVSTTVSVSVISCRQANNSTDNGFADVPDSGSSVKDQVLSGGDDRSGDYNLENGSGPKLLDAYAKLFALPNPNDGYMVTLRWEGLSNFDRTITVRVIDASGKIVHLESVNYDLTGSAEKGLTFPAKLSQGVYTIETVHDNHYINTRMIVQ
jgi:rRNA maturation protein Nop10